MKSYLLILFMFYTMVLFSQASFKGGSYTGDATSNLTATPFTIYNGWGGDGDAQYSYLAQSTFNIYSGGNNDGNTSANLAPASAFNIYNGGNYDGNASAGFASAIAFNMYKGGDNDGNSSAALAPPIVFNIYAGGHNDGNTSTSLAPATAFNIYNGGDYDGNAAGAWAPLTTFTLYKGGNNDGNSHATLLRSPDFNLYVGGNNDGNAQYSFERCNPLTAISAGVSTITANSALFSWTGANPNSDYIIRLYYQNDTALLTTYTGMVEPGFNIVPVNGLTANTAYCVTLEEKCDDTRSSGVSNRYCFTTGAAILCPSPTMAGMYGNTSTSITVGWTPGSGNTTYEVLLTRTGSLDTFRVTGNITGSYATAMLSCLPVFTNFQFHIREGCGAPGSYSAWVSGSAYTSPGCSAPYGLAATVVNTQNANLRWESNYYDQVDRPYQISYGAGITNWEQGTLTPVTAVVPAQVVGATRTHALFLSGGVGNVTWYVREVCRECDTTFWVGPYTLPVSVCNVPTATSMYIDSLTTTTATLHFTSVNYNTASQIELHNNATSTYSYYNLPPNTSYNRSLVLTTLTPATTYVWRVRDVCSVNNTTVYTPWQNFTTPDGSTTTCTTPTNQGIWFTSGQYLMVKWDSPLYGDGTKAYQIASGMNIGSPAQATLVRGGGYHITQNPAFASLPYPTGNVPGFTWYVRDICAPTDTSAWLGPYVVGTSKTDGTDAALITESNTPADLLFEVYPNPNTGEVVNIRVEGEQQHYQLTITDLTGRVVSNIQLSNGTHAVNLTGLPAALYTIALKDANGIHVKRLLINR